MGAQEGACLSDTEGRGGRRKAHTTLTHEDNGYANGTVGGEARTNGTSLMTVEVVDPFPQASVRDDSGELQREQLYRTSGVDYFARMKGTLLPPLHHQKV